MYSMKYFEVTKESSEITDMYESRPFSICHVSFLVVSTQKQAVMSDKVYQKSREKGEPGCDFSCFFL